MLKKIKTLAAWFDIKPSYYRHDIYQQKVQEDSRTLEAIKRTRTIFTRNEELINARALRPHAFECKDELECEGCFKFEPDKIIGKPYPIMLKLQRTSKVGRNSKFAKINQKQKTKRA